MWSRRARVDSFQQAGLVLSRGGDRFTVAYRENLTAERLRNRRGLRLHVRTSEPVVVSVERREQLSVEHWLRASGIRVVDCWGAILSPTLLDFEEELDREPVRVRQSSDDAGS